MSANCRGRILLVCMKRYWAARRGNRLSGNRPTSNAGVLFHTILSGYCASTAKPARHKRIAGGWVPATGFHQSGNASPTGSAAGPRTQPITRRPDDLRPPPPALARPHSAHSQRHRYEMTTTGLRIALVFTCTYARLLRPKPAEIVPSGPPQALLSGPPSIFSRPRLTAAARNRNRSPKT